MNRIVRSLRELVFKLIMVARPNFRWLYQNRYLRMDANLPINDKRRRDFHKDRYRFAVACLNNMQALSILDAACGTGYGSDILKSLRPKYVQGIDICPQTVEYANKKYGNNNCVFKVADITNADHFEAEAFDAAVSFETIEHVEQPVRFLENIRKTLKRNGTLIISTPNEWGKTRDHKFDYDYDSFRADLNTYFKIDQIYVQNSGCLDLWVNRGAPCRLELANPQNIKQAECFIAVCTKKEMI